MRHAASSALAGPGFEVDTDDPPTPGRQRPSAWTGYDDDPLVVRVARVDGRDVVMAQRDVEYWTDRNHDVRTDLLVAGGCLAGGVAWAAGCLAAERRSERRRALSRRRPR